MKDFFDKENYNQEDIENLISNEAEESLTLEFKRAESLSKKRKNKKEIGKDVSSFANSDGGIIVYGIAEENHVATSKSFIDGNEFTKEWLEQVINTNIQRRITNLKIYPIRFEEDLEKTIYIVKIPASNLAPHMCIDNRFYRRFNFQSTAMHEYEVRNLYNKKDRTQLTLKELDFTTGSLSRRNGKPYSQEILFNLLIENISTSIEKDYKLELKVPSEFRVGNEVNLRFHFRRTDDMGNYYYTFYKDEPLFQGETTDFGTARIKITQSNLDLVSQKSMELKLYYSNDVQTQSYLFEEIIESTDLDISIFKV